MDLDQIHVQLGYKTSKRARTAVRNRFIEGVDYIRLPPTRRDRQIKYRLTQHALMVLNSRKRYRHKKDKKKWQYIEEPEAGPQPGEDYAAYVQERMAIQVMKFEQIFGPATMEDRIMFMELARLAVNEGSNARLAKPGALEVSSRLLAKVAQERSTLQNQAQQQTVDGRLKAQYFAAMLDRAKRVLI